MMNKETNMLSLLKQILPKLSMFGINLNEILQTSLKFLPKFFMEKTNNFQKKHPDLNVVIMLATQKNEFSEDEIYLIPVGLDGTVIKEQDTPLNLNEFLSQIDVEEILQNSDNEPENDNEFNQLEE